MQSALGVPSQGHGWVVHREVPPEWRKGAEVKLDAWKVWAAAACEGGHERPPWPGVGAGAPSLPSWGCKAGCPAGRGTCGAAGACGGGASAGRRRGCARWGQRNRGRAAGCCGWSTPIRYRCRSVSQPRHLLRPRRRGISPLRPQCCRDLYCCDVAHPRFSSTRCSGSLESDRKCFLDSLPAVCLLNSKKSVNPVSPFRFTHPSHLHCAGCLCCRGRSCSW